MGSAAKWMMESRDSERDDVFDEEVVVGAR